MTEKLTPIARPYALAAFEYALAHSQMAAWEEVLQTAAVIAEDANMQKLFTNPNAKQAQLLSIFSDILGSKLDAQKTNFLNLLASHQRLAALPAIADLFAKLRREYEKTITVQVTSAIPLQDKYQQKFIQALTKRLKRQVTLDCVVDPALLGGATLRAGDVVIDGSILGKLNRLTEFI